MNPYDTLGVPSNADPSSIKRAYRSKAQQNHPDKGGDKEHWHPIQRAYEILSDPERRARYDETGDTSEAPRARDAAEGKLAELFNAIINEEAFTGDIIKACRMRIASVLQDLANRINTCERKVAKLTKQLKRVVSKGDFNLYEAVLQGQIDGEQNQLDHYRNEQRIIEETRTLLDEYEDSAPEEAATITRWVACPGTGGWSNL